MASASELSHHGAAQGHDSPVDAQAAENEMLREANKAGSAAYQFDPDASPDQKRAQVQSHIPDAFHHHKPNAALLISDTDAPVGPTYHLPTPTKAGAIEPGSPSIADDATANGDIADSLGDTQWARVGWAPRFGMPGSDEPQDEGTLLDHQTWLEGKVQDKFYGDWYHNTGIIFFACLTSWVTGVLGGGLGWLFAVLSICATYYRTSLRRVRRNYRDDLSREMAKSKLETDTETLEWINSFLVKFWPIYAPVLCDTIVSSVDQVLSTSTPAFLDSLKLKQFVLGTKPPRLEHVKTYPKAEDDIVLMDWKFSFTPNDVADLTARQIKNKINPKVVLEIRLGKGLVSKGLDVIVEDMAFSGLMRVKCKLQIPFPHIEKVEMCFLERPTIDYVCKPIGGDTFGFDINFIPGLETFIMEQIHANLGPMMYDPNVFPIEVAKMLAGDPVDQAIGVLQVTMHGAQGLKNPDKFSGTPDPYAVVSINNRTPLGKTKTVHENANPHWGETMNIIITSLNDPLTINVYDYNEFRKDKELGTATFALEQFEQDDEHENQQLEVMGNGRARGVVQCDIRFFPVLEGRKLEDGTVEPPPESRTGIAKFTVEQAKDLDGTKSLIGQLSPYAVLLLNGREVHTSKKLKRTNKPIWPDATTELLIMDRQKAKLGVVLKDDRDLATDPIVGTYQIGLDDMLELMVKGQEWYNLAGVKTGRVKMMLDWKPVALRGGLTTSSGYLTPVGVMRLHFQSARDLRNVETMGKSDPYVRVLLSGVERGRTVTFKNNLNPEWDEVIYVPMHSTREKLLLEVMDEEHLGRDRPLGGIELAAADYMQQDENGEYVAHEDKTTRSEGLHMGGRSSSKGTLNYTCCFYPAEHVWDPEEEDESMRVSSELDVSRRSSVRSSVSGTPHSTKGHAKKESRAETVGTISSLRTATTANSDTDLAKQLAKNEHEQELVVAKKEVPKIHLSAADLPNYESGLIVFKLIEGDFVRTDCYVDVLMGDMVFPCYSSAKIKSKHMVFNDVGDTMVRELDFSKITLRLIEHIDKKGEGNESHVLAKLAGNTIETLTRCLYTPTVLTLKDNDGRDNRITVSLKYLPIKMQLDPSESFNNQGTLRVDVLDAADLPAADRNGFSDPYCRFILHDKEVYKTKIQKKTLHPAWNEFFEVPIRSRTAAKFRVDVFDWDFGDKADFLGRAAINLDILEPFLAQTVDLGLDGKSGTIRLKVLFRPDYVVRSRQGSSTFSGTFAAPGKVIGAPVKGVGKGAVFVGGGVVKGASFLGRGFKRRKSRGASGAEDFGDRAESPGIDEPVPAISVEPTANGAENGTAESPTRPSTSTPNATSTPSPHTRQKSWGTQSISSHFGQSAGGAAEHGTAAVSVLSAAGFPQGTNLRVHVQTNSSKGARDVFKTKHIKTTTGAVAFDGETIKLPCAADVQFKLVVKDHSTLRSDEELGEGTFFVDDSASGGALGAEKHVPVGPGSVSIRSGFAREDGGGSGPQSPKLRKSLLVGRRERSVTPGT